MPGHWLEWGMEKLKNWMKSLAEKFTSPDPKGSTEPPNAPVAPITPKTPSPTTSQVPDPSKQDVRAPAPTQQTVPPPKPIRREILDEPERTSAQKVTFINSGEEIKVVERGDKTYAVCPKCESMWNILERTRHPRFRSQEGPKELTCPSCDQPVSLPATLDLRRL